MDTGNVVDLAVRHSMELSMKIIQLQDENDKLRAALKRLMDQPSPILHIRPDQRKDLWDAYAQAREVLNPPPASGVSASSPPDTSRS